jgi:hypothetical protein
MLIRISLLLCATFYLYERMKLEADTLPYVRGEKFSNSLKVKVNYHGQIPDRVSFLTELARGKRIVHLGCLDHLPLIEEKIKRKQWLHKELSEAAASCVGIDIDEEAGKFVMEKLGVKNVLISDFTQQALPSVTSTSWDYAILGELLEHIDNPVSFLSSIRERYSSCIDRIIVTVPNAWTRTTIAMASKSIEIINSDHRYWFTPYTLTKVLHQSGIDTEALHFANRVPLTTMELVAQKVSKVVGHKPAYDFTYASSIIAIGAFRK